MKQNNNTSHENRIIPRKTLPTIEEIEALLAENNNQMALIEFESGVFHEIYKKKLQTEFTTYYLTTLGINTHLWVFPAMETTKIATIANDLYECALSFSIEAAIMMTLFGKMHHFNPNNSSELFEIKRQSRANKQRGSVNEDWDFWFHGAECQFVNKKTGQLIELIITNGTEFGALSDYFFLNYIRTTPKFQKLADFFEKDDKSIHKSLDVLEEMGYLVRTEKNGLVVNKHI